MKLLPKSSKNDCGITAIQTLLGITYEAASELMPGALTPDPDTGTGIRGTTYTDLALAALAHGYALVHIDRDDTDDFEKLIASGAGLVARINPGGKWHIAAFSNQLVYDSVFDAPVPVHEWYPVDALLLFKI